MTAKYVSSLTWKLYCLLYWLLQVHSEKYLLLQDLSFKAHFKRKLQFLLTLRKAETQAGAGMKNRQHGAVVQKTGI